MFNCYLWKSKYFLFTDDLKLEHHVSLESLSIVELSYSSKKKMKSIHQNVINKSMLMIVIYFSCSSVDTLCAVKSACISSSLYNYFSLDNLLNNTLLLYQTTPFASTVCRFDRLFFFSIAKFEKKHDWEKDNNNNNKNESFLTRFNNNRFGSNLIRTLP